MAKKIRSKRIVLGGAIIILILLTYVCYTIGYVPIVGNYIAEKKLSEYASLLTDSTSDIETKYDWYNGKYRVIGEKGTTLSYRLKTNTIYDEVVAKQVNQQAKTKYNVIKEAVPDHLQLPKSIYLWTEINGNDYSSKSQRLYLLDVYNRAELSEEESQEMPAKIVQQFINLMGRAYHFTGLQFIYYDKNGGYTIEIPMDSFKRLEYDDLLKQTRKMEQEELPKDYFEWLAQQ